VVASLGPFVVATAELVRQPGHARPVSVAGELEGLALSDAWVPAGAEVTADLQLEVVTDGKLTAVGEVRTRWEGACRRCLREVGGELAAEVSEVFEPSPADDADTYPLGADRVDLEPMLRDAVLLALPLAPLCDEVCAGPDPDDHPVSSEGEAREQEPDPRWAALGELRFD
jgi:uncharacterized protein